ncbi:hypothetical protein DVJ78_17915 (plasmid) [Humibacter sp. BT305]|nr:hypothetical protein DVJ78_17915 [Humibacter sp. BT305]
MYVISGRGKRAFPQTVPARKSAQQSGWAVRHRLSGAVQGLFATVRAADEPTPTDLWSVEAAGYPKVAHGLVLTHEHHAADPDRRALQRLQQEHDGDIVATGGLRLASGVLASGELDRLRILLMPQVAGTGRSIFSEGQAPRDFDLVNSTAMDTGAIILSYRPRA